ncbi:MAG: hypothetical protein IPJ34_31560 [Myxococcales bacterium]|nr:hypothetical protein [Myxococcales bacterium]
MRRTLFPIVSLVAASACGGPAAPSASPASTAASSSSATAASSPPPLASASAPVAPKAAPGWLVNGKPAHEADAFDVEAAVKKAGWKTEGFLYGGTVGALEQYGVAATQGAKKARIGFTRKASKPNEAPAFAAKYDRKTLYKLAAVTKEAPLLKSIDDEAHELFCWITDDKGTTADDAKALFDAVFAPAK